MPRLKANALGRARGISRRRSASIVRARIVTSMSVVGASIIGARTTRARVVRAILVRRLAPGGPRRPGRVEHVVDGAAPGRRRVPQHARAQRAHANGGRDPVVRTSRRQRRVPGTLEYRALQERDIRAAAAGGRGHLRLPPPRLEHLRRYRRRRRGSRSGGRPRSPVVVAVRRPHATVAGGPGSASARHGVAGGRRGTWSRGRIVGGMCHGVLVQLPFHDPGRAPGGEPTVAQASPDV